jgi:hypothetical protein
VLCHALLYVLHNRILNEADYQKHKEIDYHEQTASMNQAAMWFPMIQVSEGGEGGGVERDVLLSFYPFIHVNPSVSIQLFNSVVML